MSITYWGDAEDPLAWDSIYINGELWPGVASVSGKGVSRKIGVARVKGSDGANLKDEGYNPGELTLSFLVYNQTDWIDLQAKLSTVHPRRKGGPREPITLGHPVADLIGINKIYIKTIKAPSFNKQNQWITLDMDVIEWFPAPKPVQKGAGTADKDEKKTVCEEVNPSTDKAYAGHEPPAHGAQDVGKKKAGGSDNTEGNMGYD